MESTFLDRIKKEIGTTPIVPLVKQTSLQNLFTRPDQGIDPGSLYGAFQQNPEEAMMSAVMGLTTPITKEEILREALRPPASMAQAQFQPIGLYNNIGKKLNITGDIMKKALKEKIK